MGGKGNQKILIMNKVKQKNCFMARFLLKSMFGYAALAELNAGEQVKVACQTWLECNSVKSMASQYPKAHPKDGISKYPTEIEKQGNGYIVTVTAVK